MKNNKQSVFLCGTGGWAEGPYVQRLRGQGQGVMLGSPQVMSSAWSADVTLDSAGDDVLTEGVSVGFFSLCGGYSFP